MVTWGKALTKSRNGFFSKVTGLLLGKKTIGEDDLEQIEERLLGADLPVRLVDEFVDQLESGRHDRKRTPEEILKNLLSGSLPQSRPVEWDQDCKPYTILVVGVNGTGKTTTTAKLARKVVKAGLTPLLGAADTFRAAGSDQLGIWGERIGCRVVTGRQGGDSSAVAFDAVKAGVANSCDVVIIDTAGRMHTKAPLMQELKKVRASIEKSSGREPDETWVVLDATQGQNTLAQARVFNEMVPLTGAVVTKLDGSSKAGFLFAVHRELGIPIKFAGLGEGENDLVDFDSVEFIDALVGKPERGAD